MGDTRAAVFAAAAAAFSARGFDGVRVEEVARAAGVNKAMLYYHFGDKLALYRAVVADMMREVGGRVLAIAESPGEPDAKVEAVIDAFLGAAETRPWFPTLMLREVSDGAPHLDMETLGLMRNVFLGFSRVLGEGQAAGRFREMHPVLAYVSFIGPILLNAARERVAAANPARATLPMFVALDRAELRAHMHQAALRMLQKDTPR